MKAPDKLYIDDLAVVNDCNTKVSVKPLPNFSEYIRKDYLLEWAKDHREAAQELHATSHDDYDLGHRDAFLILIDKLEEI